MLLLHNLLLNFFLDLRLSPPGFLKPLVNAGIVPVVLSFVNDIDIFSNSKVLVHLKLQT